MAKKEETPVVDAEVKEETPVVDAEVKEETPVVDDVELVPVKFLKSPVGYGYFQGDDGFVFPDDLDKLRKDGVVE